MTLISGFIGAAWVIYSTVVASINFGGTIDEYASNYRHGDTFWGNNLGLYELIAIIMHQFWAFVLTMWTLWFGFDLWAQVEKREKGYKTEGRGGEVVDIVEAMKMMNGHVQAEAIKYFENQPVSSQNLRPIIRVPSIISQTLALSQKLKTVQKSLPGQV